MFSLAKKRIQTECEDKSENQVSKRKEKAEKTLSFQCHYINNVKDQDVQAGEKEPCTRDIAPDQLPIGLIIREAPRKGTAL